MSASTESGAGAPLLSFGIPVRNGARFLPRLLDSIVAQDFGDFEVVVCDNASTDDTASIVKSHRDRDARYRYLRVPRDLGQIRNFNRVFRLSRGKYFRWIGADDRLDPTYARRCVEALEAHPWCIGCTTLWRYEDDDGHGRVERYEGRRVDSGHALHRMSRMLWFLQTSYGIDPIYSMLRRDALLRTGLLSVSPWTDRALALELAVLGPFCHVHDVLAVRRNAGEPARIRLSRYHPGLELSGATDDCLAPRWTMYRDLARVVWASSLDSADKLLATPMVVGYGLAHHARAASRRARTVLRLRAAA